MGGAAGLIGKMRKRIVGFKEEMGLPHKIGPDVSEADGRGFSD